MNIYDDISRLMNTYGSSKAPTHEENREHFKQLITCEDETELNNYAVANIRMVASVVNKFLKRHPWAVYLLDDLFSTALCTMFESLRTMVKRANEDSEDFWSDIGTLDTEGRFSVSMYIYISMYRSVQKCFEEDAVEAISQTTVLKFTPEGSQKPIHKLSFHNKNLDGFQYDHFNIVYLLDDILEHCETDFERKIIEMRLTMDDPTIAESLGRSKAWVQRVRKKVYERYQCSLQNE